VEKLLQQHEKDLDNALNKHNTNRDRQMEDLRKRLADRRRQREQQLKQKHAAEV
jgi:hypothetical protein